MEQWKTAIFISFIFCLSPFHLHAFLLLFVYSSCLFASMVCKNAFVPLVPVEDNELFDFRGFRLDWFRLQVCLMMIVVKCIVMVIVVKCMVMMIDDDSGEVYGDDDNGEVYGDDD